MCSPCHFFRLGTAHIILLGLLSDFWAQWLPSAAHNRKAATHPESAFAYYVLPSKVRKHIEAMAGYIKLTELFAKPYRDINKCAPSYSSCTVAGISNDYSRLQEMGVISLALQVQVPKWLAHGGLDGFCRDIFLVCAS